MAETLQQTQTLSLRFSEVLRKRLEDIRKLTALRKGESVSKSEIAKQLAGVGARGPLPSGRAGLEAAVFHRANVDRKRRIRSVSGIREISNLRVCNAFK